tara:strand:+ start:1072 stop:1371 length:300 start_codon:yes stop_codon:yes gene_type:complete
MEKFLSIPVTNEQSQLVSASGVKIIEVGDPAGNDPTTKTTLFYAGGKKITLTHAAVAAGSEEMRDKLQDEVVMALQQTWRNVVKDVVGLPKAVSAIVIA